MAAACWVSVLAGLARRRIATGTTRVGCQGRSETAALAQGKET
jgi:hypothetical protein